MVAIPGWLLRETLIVEPLVGAGRYGPAVAVAAALNETPGTDVAPSSLAGRAWTSIDAVAQLGSPVPVSARATLPDGRMGMVVAALARTGGGLPVPDHLEIRIKLPAMVGNTTVTIYRGGVDNGFGDQVPVNTGGTLVAAGVAAAVSRHGDDTATVEQKTRAYDVTRGTVQLAPGTDVQIGDRLVDDTTGAGYRVLAVDPSPMPGIPTPVVTQVETIT